jgi:hypothetical protein
LRVTPILFLRQRSLDTPETAGVVRHSTSLAGTHRYEVQTESETAILLIMGDNYPMDDELAEALYDYLDRQRKRNATDPKKRCG